MSKKTVFIEEKQKQAKNMKIKAWKTENSKSKWNFF